MDNPFVECHDVSSVCVGGKMTFFGILFVIINSQGPDGAHLHTTHADQIFDQS